MLRPSGDEPTHPFVKILEQPCAVYRFRYLRERDANGSIQGASSTKEVKTYPRIKIFNYVGLVMIRVSCVDHNTPHKPHPHRIVGRRDCENGVFKIETRITETQREVELTGIGIQCVRRQDVSASLEQRRRQHVDPFRTGFEGADLPSSYHDVRLAIEVLMPDQGGRFRMPMAPVCSLVVTDRSRLLQIAHMSHHAGSARGSAAGGVPLTMFTSKLPSSDGLLVRFFEESTNWEVLMRPNLIHKMVGIVVSVPPYRDPDTPNPVTVKVELCYRSTNEDNNSSPSNAMSYVYEPEWMPHARRRRISSSSSTQPVAKHRRVDDKSLNTALFKAINDASPVFDVDSIRRDVEREPWASKADIDAAGPSNYRAKCDKKPNQYNSVYERFVLQPPTIEPSCKKHSSQTIQFPPVSLSSSNVTNVPTYPVSTFSTNAPYSPVGPIQPLSQFPANAQYCIEGPMRPDIPFSPNAQYSPEGTIQPESPYSVNAQYSPEGTIQPESSYSANAQYSPEGTIQPESSYSANAQYSPEGPIQPESSYSVNAQYSLEGPIPPESSYSANAQYSHEGIFANTEQFSQIQQYLHKEYSSSMNPFYFGSVERSSTLPALTDATGQSVHPALSSQPSSCPTGPGPGPGLGLGLGLGPEPGPGPGLGLGPGPVHLSSQHCQQKTDLDSLTIKEIMETLSAMNSPDGVGWINNTFDLSNSFAAMSTSSDNIEVQDPPLHSTCETTSVMFKEKKPDDIHR